MATYEASQIDRVVQGGPGDGEEWFRMQVTGKRASKWLNVSEDQLRRIAAILNDENA